MADAFTPGQQVTVRWQSAAEKESRIIDAMVLEHESSGRYRIHTTMGFTALVRGEDITAKANG